MFDMGLDGINVQVPTTYPKHCQGKNTLPCPKSLLTSLSLYFTQFSKIQLEPLLGNELVFSCPIVWPTLATNKTVLEFISMLPIHITNNLLFQNVSVRWFNSFVICLLGLYNFEAEFFVKGQGCFIVDLYMQHNGVIVPVFFNNFHHMFEHMGTYAQPSVGCQTAQSHDVQLSFAGFSFFTSCIIYKMKIKLFL